MWSKVDGVWVRQSSDGWEKVDGTWQRTKVPWAQNPTQDEERETRAERKKRHRRLWQKLRWTPEARARASAKAKEPVVQAKRWATFKSRHPERAAEIEAEHAYG